MSRPDRYHAAAYASRGFTLVELLTVIAIIGGMAALLLPAIQQSREAARKLECANRLRQIGLGMQAFHAARQAFPVGCQERRTASRPQALQLAWTVRLLPYLECQDVWGQIDLRQAYDSPRNRSAAMTAIPLYLCPSLSRHALNRRAEHTGDGLGAADYAGMFGASAPSLPMANGVLLFDRAIRDRDVSDGLSNTILVTEDTGRGTAQDGQWINGQNVLDVSVSINQIQHNEMWSDHPGGVQALFCDGSVQWLTDRLDIVPLHAMCTRAQGDRN